MVLGTLFPYGNCSVCTNYELLGFYPLQLDIKVDYELLEHYNFEKIK